MGDVNEWLSLRPVRAAAVLTAAAAFAYLCYRLGAHLLTPTEGLPEGQRSLLGRFVAWPGGTWISFAGGAIALGLLLIPDGRLEGRWRWALARLAWWASIGFAALQLLDDHLMGQPGTGNPLAVEIPSPFQDLLELPFLAVLAATLIAAVAMLPVRLLHDRRVSP